MSTGARVTAARVHRWLAAAGALALTCACGPAPSDYEVELAGIEHTMTELRRAPGDDLVARLRLVFQTYRRAALTADYADFAAAERAIDEALETCGPLEDLLFLSASLDFKLHRNERAAATMARLGSAADSARVIGLAGDLCLQSGRYSDARARYESADQPTWDVLARRAYLAACTGAVEEAERLYVAAQDELTAKELRSYAWIELQRGILDLDVGRESEALAHFQTADRVYSGYWLIEEHMAEALDLLGRTDDAILLYEKVIAASDRPEYRGALARILARRHDARAPALAAEAEAGFAAQRRLYPEAAVGHYLEFLLEADRPAEGLLEIAEENHRLRPNGDAKLRLAEACLVCNQPSRALALLDELRGSGWRPREVEALARRLY